MSKVFEKPTVQIRVTGGLHFDYRIGPRDDVGDYRFQSADVVSDSRTIVERVGLENRNPAEFIFVRWPCGHKELTTIRLVITAGLSFNYNFGSADGDGGYRLQSVEYFGTEAARDLLENVSLDEEDPASFVYATWPCGHKELLRVEEAGKVADALEKVLNGKADEITVDGGAGTDFEFSELDTEDETVKVAGEDTDTVSTAVAKRIVLALRTIGNAALPKGPTKKAVAAATAAFNSTMKSLQQEAR